MGSKIPSPCIDVCKYKLDKHCIGCGMTKQQRKAFKKLKGRKAKSHFLNALIRQQEKIGLKANWLRAYRRRCDKKGVDCPIDA